MIKTISFSVIAIIFMYACCFMLYNIHLLNEWWGLPTLIIFLFGFGIGAVLAIESCS